MMREKKGMIRVKKMDVLHERKNGLYGVNMHGIPRLSEGKLQKSQGAFIRLQDGLIRFQLMGKLAKYSLLLPLLSLSVFRYIIVEIHQVSRFYKASIATF